MSVDTFLFPASFAQRRLWYIAQLEPDSSVYHVPIKLGLSGQLDVPALERSLATIVSRHEVLRTTLSLIDGEPTQVVRDLALTLPVVEIGGATPAEREAECKRLSGQESIRPFDLEQGPLFRTCLYRLAPDEHVFLIVLHHAVFDGWSGAVLHRELTECYRAYSSGQEPSLSELPVQYGDFSVWQREWLSGDVLDRLLAYWRAQLAGASPVLELPTDFRRPQIQTYRGAGRSRLMPPPLLHQLKALSQREGCTLFMTLLAAFQVLLSRYTGEHDIVVGTPIANRTRSELEHLIGFFVNSLALRTDLSGDPSFRELLGRVREVALGAYAHQDLPFDKLVEELPTARIRDRNPVFQVLFAMQNAPGAPLQLPGISLRRIGGKRRTSKFDLSLHAAEGSKGLRAIVEYSSDLFDASTMDRLLEHYQTLLENVVADPSRRLSSVSLTSPEERHQVVESWNGTSRPYDRDQCVHRAFEARTAERPDAVAVRAPGVSLTYGELDRRANQLAHALRRRGVGPAVPVGLALERSADVVVSLLAILKAGGAYVPLDLSYPPERTAFMLEDARISLVITTADADLMAPSAVAVLRLDADRGEIEAGPDHPLESGTSPEDLAYIMYTSGSTGRPKGVAVSHRNVMRLVRGVDYARLGPDEVMIQLAPLAFDASTFEVWGALLNGGSLVVAPPNTSAPQAIGELVRRYGVTTMWLTAGLFHLVVDEGAAHLVGLRQLLAGGDVLSPAHIARFQRECPGCRLINGYGPTETTTFATTHEIAAVPAEGASIPIGKPIANVRTYVLDPRLEPVPIGVPGELYIGGDGVAREYVGRRALTAERFIPDPFSGVPGARMYRTGDRVRWRPHGTLEFLGRLDQQVKVRGFRVEPGEVEAALALHPDVRDCAVIARDDLPGGRALVAYVVLHPAVVEERGSGAEDGWSRELRSYLRARLPDFMVPSAFALLDSLPLSPNGKVARRALPRPALSRSGPGATLTPPRSPTESMLAKIWTRLLGVDRVGLEDDFFELGGHSLLALRLFSEIEGAFGWRLPVSTLFRAPTLGALADLLSQERIKQSDTGLVPLRPQGSRPPLFVVHGAYGDVLEYRQLGNSLGSDQPVYGFEPPLGPDGAPILSTIEQLAARYIRQMREFQPEGPYYICGYCWAGPLAFEMACQLRDAGGEIGLLALIDSRCPGTRSQGGLQARARRKHTKIWTLVREQTRSLLQLRPRAVPGFLHQRILNICTRIVGVRAYRWSVRLGRPLLPAFREIVGAMLHAGRNYRPRPYPGRVTVLYAQPPGNPPLRDPSLGWNRVAALGTESHAIAGEHESIMYQPLVDQLAARLRACLHLARTGAP